MTFSYEIIEVGNPLLYQVAEEVTDFSCAELKKHISAMHRLMQERNGVGIAAPQVGVSLQVMIVASRPNERYPNAPEMEPTVLINPKIESVSDRQVVDWEGCLSVPGIRGRVRRADEVTVVYFDEAGEQIRKMLKGFPARIFLHEYDHLIGKTFLDQVASSADLFSEKEYLRAIGAN